MTFILRSDTSGLVEHAPAKLNLALHVRGRRADGYHELETIFAFTNFGDTLRAAPSDGLTLTVDGEFAGPAGIGEDNLVLRAARALAAAAGVMAVLAFAGICWLTRGPSASPVPAPQASGSTQ